MVVWAFISYMGLAFEKPQHIRMECFLTGPTCHVSCGATEQHLFYPEVKKYINRERERGRKQGRRSLRLGPALLIIVPFKGTFLTLNTSL